MYKWGKTYDDDVIRNYKVNHVHVRYFQFLKQILFPKRTTVSSACSTLIKHATISRLESLLEWFK